MSIIKKLPLHLANQIAAGEVVQRPESVIKELVENSLDAGADDVTIIISNAGKTLISVIDNGSGMSEDDVPLAFERHATSKIASYDDLERVVTFGFRGEALPSIASVAQVEVKSRRASDDVATQISMDGGFVQERTKTHGDVGTTIAVKNLFFNTPARRQYLKSNATEFRHINDAVHRFLLSYPTVGFTFISDGETIVRTDPATLRERLPLVFGDKVASTMIDVQELTDELTVTGFISRPNFARKSRGDQYLFLNTRFIVNRMLNHAVVSAYEHMIESSEYPPYVLFLGIAPTEVDVNVHPAKLEVKFKNERMIYTMLQTIVRRGLYHHDLTPSMKFRSDGGSDSTDRVRLMSPHEEAGGMSGGGGGRNHFSQHATEIDSFTRAENRTKIIDALFKSIGDSMPDGTMPPAQIEHEATAVAHESASSQAALWQLHNKYILTPVKTGIMFIDQHVAHERILYERSLDTMASALPFAQQLLFPHSVRMSQADYALVEELLSELRNLGFVLAIEPPNFVTVEGVPQDVRIGMEERILEELLEQYKEYQSLGTTEARDALAKAYACRAAIKSGDKLQPQEMQKLIDELFMTKVPYVCPHGRPIVIRMSLDDIDRKFGRTS